MAEEMRFLLILGFESIAMNRRVVQELEMKLKKASEEELSKAERLELINVIKLLREQESAFSKQDRMSEQLSKNTIKIDEIIVVDERQNQKDIEHNTLIQENSDINNKQQIEIERQKQIDEKHDKSLKSTCIFYYEKVFIMDYEYKPAEGVFILMDGYTFFFKNKKIE